MEIYITLNDLLRNPTFFLDSVKNDDRFVIQSPEGETLGVLVSDVFVSKLETLTQNSKVMIENEM